MTVVLAEAEGYVAAAYLVFLGLLLVYVAIMATRMARIERELGELSELAAKRDPDRDGEREVPA